MGKQKKIEIDSQCLSGLILIILIFFVVVNQEARSARQFLKDNPLISCAWRLHPGTKKARKGNVGTSVEWRLNSENDSRLHGQPSFALFSWILHALSFLRLTKV